MTHTPENAAAIQLLARLWDTAPKAGQAVLLRAAARLTGRPVDALERLWRLTT